MTETNTWVDRTLAAAVGIAAFVLLFVWAFPGVHPAAWNDIAISAGLVPQDKMLPGFGSFAIKLVFLVLPYSLAMAVQSALAKLAIAACGFMAYYVFAWMMQLVAGMGARDIRRRTIAIRISATVAALAFVCADPMWRAAQDFTGSTFVILLFTFSAYTFLRLLVTASPASAVAMLLALGLLAAETPLGWLALVTAVFVTFSYLKTSRTPAWQQFTDPVRIQRTKWMMTFVFIAAFVVGALGEMFAFAMSDGLRASGISAGELPVSYVSAYWGLIVDSMNFAGLCAILLACIMPCVLTVAMLQIATDEDRYLSFKFSIVFFLASAVAFLQLSPYNIVWFWTIPGDNAVTSQSVLLVGSFLSALTVACGLYVLGVEIFCRDYKHIENVMYQSYAEEGGEVQPGGKEVVTSVRLTFGRLAMLIVPVVILLLLIPGRRLPDDRHLCSLMNAFIKETLDEAAGVKYLFTDGSYDSALRLESKRRGIGIIPVSLMGGTSRRDAYIRSLGSSGFEDRMVLEAGAAEALRTWVLAKSELLSDVAVQIAFEIFRLNRRLQPVVYGTLVRPTGADAAAAAESVARCHELSDKIVDAHERGVYRHAKDSFIKDRFLFAQFRLAVMSRLRAINLDAAKKVKESLEEIAYSDKLNANNPSLIRILRKMDWVKRQSGEALTPREGVEVALKRADFVMARRYAMPVLKEDPDEPNANFAVGMSYYVEEQFAKAEEYLRKVLKRKPNEGAVYNNIALIQLRTGRLEEAQTNIVKALKLFPDSPEIKDTARQIQKAREDKPNLLKK